MANCQGTTKADNPCKRKAWKGSTFCKLHAPEPEEAESRARDRGVGNDFHQCFQEIIDWTDELKDDPPDNLTSLVSLGKLKLDATRAAIEHQRLADGMGMGAEYRFVMMPPAEVEVVPEVVGDDGDEERVLN